MSKHMFTNHKKLDLKLSQIYCTLKMVVLFGLRLHWYGGLVWGRDGSPDVLDQYWKYCPKVMDNKNYSTKPFWNQTEYMEYNSGVLSTIQTSISYKDLKIRYYALSSCSMIYIQRSYSTCRRDYTVQWKVVRKSFSALKQTGKSIVR